MAFIPDDSYDQRLTDNLSPLVWEFYQYLCRKRNHEQRLSSGTVDEFILKYKYKRASKFNLLKELKTSKWISGEDGKYSLNVGDFSPVDKKADERKAKKEQSKKIDSTENQSKKIDPKSKKIDESSKKIDSTYIRNKPASLPAVLPASEENASATIDGIFDNFQPPQQTKKDKFLQTCVDGMKTRLKTPSQLPNRLKWIEVFEFWFANEATAENLLETFDVKDEIRVRKKDSWQMSPSVLENSFGKLESLKAELEIVKNGISSGNNRNGVGRVSERDKSAERSRTAKAMVAELRRVGEAERNRAEQNLLSNGDGTG